MAIEKVKRREVNRKIKQISGGLLFNLTDLVLGEMFFSMNLLAETGSSPRRVWRSFYQAQEDLAVVNAQTFSRAIYYLKKKGLIDYVRDDLHSKPRITRQGRARLAAVLPEYLEERPWDGKIYLVTYDIPELQRDDREILRDHLKKIGCGMLQASVWLTPYNPRETLQDFIHKKNLEGLVIVSDLGRGGSVGRMKLEELVDRVYDLSALNSRYALFVSKYKGKKKGEVDGAKVGFEFLSILKDDPQLPFELLTTDWEGEQAYLVYQRLTD